MRVGKIKIKKHLSPVTKGAGKTLPSEFTQATFVSASVRMLCESRTSIRVFGILGSLFVYHFLGPLSRPNLVIMKFKLDAADNSDVACQSEFSQSQPVKC